MKENATEHRKDTLFSRRVVRFCALLSCAAVIVAGDSMAWGNGNTSADVAPTPIKKSVRKATIKKPARKAKKTAKEDPCNKKKKSQKKAVSKSSVKTAPKARPARTSNNANQLTSLQKGVLLLQQERYEAAFPHLERAVRQEPRRAEVWYWYGQYFDKTGSYEQAQFFYRKALSIDPAFAPFSRAVVYPAEGDRLPLWDPKRPARVYSIPTVQEGVAIIPPNAPQANRYPARPAGRDPQIPNVPHYVPPSPQLTPFSDVREQEVIYRTDIAPQGESVLLEETENTGILLAPSPSVRPVYQPPHPPAAFEKRKVKKER